MHTPKAAPLSAALLALTLAACSAPAAPSTGSSPAGTPGGGAGSSNTESSDGGTAGSGHGTIAGAAEMAEPQLHLLTLDPQGAVGMLDLADESTTEAGPLPGADAISTDGRYVFASSAEPGTVTILDSGTWTWDHEDHFHYYRSSPRLVGKVEGEGGAIIAPGATRTGVFFPESGKGLLLDNDALAKGEIRTATELTGEPHDGLVLPLGTFALATVPNAAGDGAGDRANSGVAAPGGNRAADRVQVYDADGAPVAGAEAPCVDAEGSITTPVGAVIGCADGALLATMEDGAVSFEHIPYPAEAMEAAGSSATSPDTQPQTQESRALQFRAREGRPTVAAVAGTKGVWLLDTRERSWQLLETEVPLHQVSAVDDKEGHVVALSAQGEVLVLSAKTGTVLSRTEPLLPETLHNPDLLAGVELVADQQRAYLNAPAERKLYEIDFADGGRLARTFDTPAVPAFLAVTGR